MGKKSVLALFWNFLHAYRNMALPMVLAVGLPRDMGGGMAQPYDQATAEQTLIASNIH